MNARGSYGTPLQFHASPRIGAVLFHGWSDRDTAAAQINTQVQALKNAVLTAAGADPGLVSESEYTIEKFKNRPHIVREIADAREAIDKSQYASLWYDGVSPLYNEWNSFYADKRHWYDQFTKLFTSWEDYLSWAKRVDELRSKVEGAGIKIALPRLQEFSKSFQEKGEEAAADVWKFAKYGAYGALGLGAIVVLTSVAMTIKKGNEPIAHYTELYRKRGAP